MKVNCKLCMYNNLNPENIPCCFCKNFDKFILGTPENIICTEKD